MNNRTYDIILYGATSHTSKFIIPHFLEENYNIALAARDSSKIESFGLPTLSCEIGEIDKLTKNTKIFLNCVGPYCLTGEAIVRSCVSNKTHYLDISGETMFVNKLREKLDEEAKRNKTYIVNCCGFDSVPADVGVEYLKKQFDCDISVESTIIVSNPVCNKATWVSLIHSLSRFAKRPTKNHLKKEKEFNWSEEFGGFRVIFRGIDSAVVRRTQQLTSECVIRFLCSFKAGANLLIRFFGFFSHGIVKENPPKEILKRSSFEMNFRAIPMNQDDVVVKTLKISGPDPGLQFTGICASQCALTLLELLNESDRKQHLKKVPGGCVTPGFIFRDSNLITRLKMKGIKFD